MIPEFELWIKASVIDKYSKGACPLCQQWYMVAYILAENKLASFKVITVPESSPPRILKEKSSSGLFPVVIGISGETQNGDSVEGLVADESCELEKFFQNFKCPLLRMDAAEQIAGLSIFLDLNRVFNMFLTTGSVKKLNDIMTRIDDHLKDKGTKYMICDELTYVDCVLLPRLQHVRVAGIKLKSYDIPYNLVHLWQYIKFGYAADAFCNTCPTDPVIICHYQKKVNKRGIEASLMKETTTLTIPDDVVLDIKSEEVEEIEDFEQVVEVDGLEVQEVVNQVDEVDLEAQEVVNQVEEVDGLEVQEMENNVEVLSEMTSNISVENSNGIFDFNGDTGEVDVVSDNTSEVIVVEEGAEGTKVTEIVTTSDLDYSHTINGENPKE